MSVERRKSSRGSWARRTQVVPRIIRMRPAPARRTRQSFTARSGGRNGLRAEHVLELRERKLLGCARRAC